MHHPDDDDRRRPGEVEIIPPGRAARDDPRRRRKDEPVWVSGQRIYIARPGPLGMLLGLIGLAALLAVGFLVFLGLFVLWLPLLGIIAVGVIVSAFLRGPRRP
ncbi:MAG TPA: hypothetical protein VMU87_04640 [Stellaceae bacterium]|nr:hypothetical protein [Stellaceae bacterium]